MRLIFFGLFVAFALAKPGSMPSSMPSLLTKPLDFWKYTPEATEGERNESLGSKFLFRTADGRAETCNCNKDGTEEGDFTCDAVTGKCHCKCDVEGDKCDGCTDGHKDFPDCHECNCNADGSANFICDKATGQCTCNSLVVGLTCNKCDDGYFDFPNPCQSCECNADGSKDNADGSKSITCTEVGGKCFCKDNVSGDKCDVCESEHYGFPTCEHCSCNADGSVDQMCDHNGKCSCKDNVDGQKCSTCSTGYDNFPDCDKCAAKYYGYPTCIGCQCNLETSVDNVCAVDDGKCTCKDNIAGHLCDKSAECWWNFPNPEECLCRDEGSEGCTCTEKEGICHCKPNIEGDKCDQCKPSYWSYPECLACDCISEGSVNLNCDDNGRCMCNQHVEGDKCDVCKTGYGVFPDCDQCIDGYHGYPNCIECTCNMGGSVDNVCDVTTGECNCKPNFIGDLCDQVADGWWDFAAPKPCDCHIHCYEEDTDYEGDDIGGNIYTNIANAHDCQAKCHLNKDCLYWSFMDPSMNHKWAGNCWLKDGKGTVKSFSGVTSGPKYCISDISVEKSGSKTYICDKSSGKCDCNDDVIGDKCTQCESGYWGFPKCQKCTCISAGSENDICNVETGACTCKSATITSHDCSTCADQYYGFPTCGECMCDDNGANGNKLCDKESGQCSCNPHVVGLKCKTCADEYWAFPDCQACECNAEGSNGLLCDDSNGKCTCKSNVIGHKCDQCGAGYWGFPTCQDCACNPDGRKDNTCDITSGQCSCIDNVSGLKCDACAIGWYGFSNCKQCNCYTLGSVGIGCTDDGGVCTCNSGYKGTKCNECEAGFFMVNGKCNEGCTIDDFAFGEHNILISGEWNEHDDWEDCQKACVAIKDCSFWTYYTDKITDKPKYCELKYADDADADFVLDGAISGPKYCPTTAEEELQAKLTWSQGKQTTTDTVIVNYIKIKTSTQDYADASDNLEITICQDQNCCTTGAVFGKLDKGSENKYFSSELGECDQFELHSDKDIDVTFNQVNKDGWLGEDVTIATYPTYDAVNIHNEWIYDCPITTWLDVDSDEHGENNPSSFVTTCKVTEVFPEG